MKNTDKQKYDHNEVTKILNKMEVIAERIKAINRNFQQAVLVNKKKLAR